MKYALVKNNAVTNVVEWDGESEFETDGELVPVTGDQMVSIGYAYDGDSFIAPEDLPHGE